MSTWARRLEAAGYASVILSMVAHLGEAPPYNATLAVFLLFAHHTNRGRHMFAALLAAAFSLLLDPMYLGSLNLHDRWNFVPLVVLPVLAVLKIVACVSCYHLFIGLGGTWSLWETSVPVEEADGEHEEGGVGPSPGRTPSLSERANTASFGRGMSFSERASGSSGGGGGGGGGGGTRIYTHPTITVPK